MFEGESFMIDSAFEQFIKITENYNNFKKNCIPLCAAENCMSHFAKLPLSSSIKEKYIMGSSLEYVKDDNFIGADIVYPYYHIISDLCNQLYDATYSDARTLTGMNAITTLLMSLTNIGDEIAVSSVDCGGHASIPDICLRLGLKALELPYDYEKLDFDYEAINRIINTNKNIKLVLICISDVVNPFDISKVVNTFNIPIIYDATQTLGLIAGNAINNPLKNRSTQEKFILMGATHKTIPGPSCGLIMTQNTSLASTFDHKINPIYIRNTQLNEKLSLIFTLLEIKQFGREYAKLTIQNARKLASILSEQGFHVLNKNNNFTNTHQIFISCDENHMVEFYNNCDYYNITLNFKTKKVFNNYGIRIGTQEISRYDWGDSELLILAEILKCLYEYPKAYLNNEIDTYVNNKIKLLLPLKKIRFTFDESAYKPILENLLF
jgi:glycine hydroxymethyltransferase